MNTQTILDQFVGTEQGWRLLDEDEKIDTEVWLKEVACWTIDQWNHTGWLGCDAAIYRTKLTRAELAKARGLEPVKAPEPCATPGQLAQLPGGADKWERVPSGCSVMVDDYGIWVSGPSAGTVLQIGCSSTTVDFWEELSEIRNVVHIYRRKPEPKSRIAKMPDAPVWFMRVPTQGFSFVAKVMNDNSGTTVGTWQQLQDRGCTWSSDRKSWFNFYGEEVK